MFSYHHVLKGYHLDGKRNRCVDHLIHMLVKEMLPIYKDCHKWQKLRMQGLNLAEKCQKEILEHAPKTPLERIKEITQLCFKVQSTSLEKMYEVNLLTYIVHVRASISLASSCASMSQRPCISLGGDSRGENLDPQHLSMQVQVSQNWTYQSHQSSRTVALLIQRCALPSISLSMTFSGWHTVYWKQRRQIQIQKWSSLSRWQDLNWMPCNAI